MARKKKKKKKKKEDEQKIKNFKFGFFKLVKGYFWSRCNIRILKGSSLKLFEPSASFFWESFLYLMYRQPF